MDFLILLLIVIYKNVAQSGSHLIFETCLFVVQLMVISNSKWAGPLICENRPKCHFGLRIKMNIDNLLRDFNPFCRFTVVPSFRPGPYIIGTSNNPRYIGIDFYKFKHGSRVIR